MTDIKADERVQLTKDVPELGLHCGDTGVVCSTWFDPGTAFEVEFRAPGWSVRALLMPNQIQKVSTNRALGAAKTRHWY